MLRSTFSVVFILALVPTVNADGTADSQWPQGGGPNGQYVVENATAPTSFSVSQSRGVKWTKVLEETGQSTVVVWEDRLFFTINKPVENESTLGSDIVAYCCDAKTGDTIWKKTIPAKYPLRLSGCFSDASAPPAVTDGKHVCFFNAGGTIACFDMQGKQVWLKKVMPVGRTQPFLLNGAVCFIRQNYMPENGKFGHQHKDLPVSGWTQLQALDLKTGEEKWTTDCGFNMGCIPVPWKLEDGRVVILSGRGGGHSPPEKPEGVSLIDGSNGKTLWTLPLPKFMSTMTLNIHGDHALIFHKAEHLWVNIQTGKIDRRISFGKDIKLRHCEVTTAKDGAKVSTPENPPTWATSTVSLSAKDQKKTRNIIQGSNILVGDWHYFRSYTRPWIGRVHVTTGKVECLQLPVQVSQTNGNTTALYTQDTSIPKQRDYKVGTGITYRHLVENDMKNSRGILVMGDDRSKGNGWGHHASQSPMVVGDYLYVPILTGIVYVLKWNAETLDENAVVAINDLGPLGKTFTRAGLSFANGNIFAHTMTHLICIGK